MKTKWKACRSLGVSVCINHEILLHKTGASARRLWVEILSLHFIQMYFLIVFSSGHKLSILVSFLPKLKHSMASFGTFWLGYSALELFLTKNHTAWVQCSALELFLANIYTACVQSSALKLFLSNIYTAWVQCSAIIFSCKYLHCLGWM